MRIAIAGPGRSGTSVLVKILEAWGFSVPGGAFHEDAAAGFEARLGSRPDLEVEKDPWAFEYIDRLGEDVLAQYSAFIIPVRQRHEAVLSRSVRERVDRAIRRPNDSWQWNSWGTVPGGVVADTTSEAISSTLGRGLWDLLHAVAAAGIQPTILHFPRFVTDFEYLWAQLSPLVSSRIEKSAAHKAWSETVDPSLVTISANPGDDPEITELKAVVEALRTIVRKRDRALSEETQRRKARETELSDLSQRRAHSEGEEAQRRTDDSGASESAHRQIASLQQQIDALQNSRSWRLTRPLRAIRRLRPH